MRFVARVVLLLTLVLGPAPVLAAPLDALVTRCGVERWPVKVMSDADAARVSLAPVETTVAALRALPAPPTLPARARIAPVELTTYAVTATVVAAKREEDSDIHLVIADPADPTQTMIVEFPDPDCTLTTPPDLAARMRTARAAFVAAYGLPSPDRFGLLTGTVHLVGVGFFDFLHGQRGVAPNGIELHPVLEFSAAQVGDRCFPETGRCIGARFRDYWEQNGGLAVFGFPITGPRMERNRDTGQTYLTQWFERNRFEIHPENQPPYDVLLGRLGDDRLRQQGIVWQSAPKAAPQAGCLYFEQTGRNVCNQGAGLGFRNYWEGHGLADPRLESFNRSLALFGLPLTDAQMETNAAGDTVLTQWFERARFEWHPNQRDEFKVLLGLLGREVGP